jgi:hypothetical protein
MITKKKKISMKKILRMKLLNFEQTKQIKGGYDPCKGGWYNIICVTYEHSCGDGIVSADCGSGGVIISCGPVHTVTCPVGAHSPS